MPDPPPTLKGVIHGRTIELEGEPGLPDGQAVRVEIRPADEPPRWLGRLDLDPAGASGGPVVKGTGLPVEGLVGLLEGGCSEDELRARHPELTPEDLEAVRQYARVPPGLRRCFGRWAGEADEVDRFVEWTYHRRTPGRPPLDP